MSDHWHALGPNMPGLELTRRWSAASYAHSAMILSVGTPLNLRTIIAIILVAHSIADGRRPTFSGKVSTGAPRCRRARGMERRARSHLSLATMLSSFLGNGWESDLFVRLRLMPDGDVECRDGNC